MTGFLDIPTGIARWTVSALVSLIVSDNGLEFSAILNGSIGTIYTASICADRKEVRGRYFIASPDSSRFLFPSRKSHLRTEDLLLISQHRAEEFLFFSKERRSWRRKK